MTHSSASKEGLPVFMDDMNLKSPTRRVKKCFVEKIRRERINTALEQLKTLILQTEHVSEDNCEKMEKADILEMTVRYLQKVQSEQKPILTMRHPNRAQNPSPADAVLEQYRAGYAQSLNAVYHHMGASQMSPGCAERLLSHLHHNAPAATASTSLGAAGCNVAMDSGYMIPIIHGNNASSTCHRKSARHIPSSIAACYKKSLPYSTKTATKRYVDKNSKSNIEKRNVCKIEIPEDKPSHTFDSNDLLIKQEPAEHSPNRNRNNSDLHLNDMPSLLNFAANDSSVWRPW